MLAIEARGIEKVYGGKLNARPALAGVDLRVPIGSAFGLIGLNGAGKTTFIKTMLGIAVPTKGVLKILGGDPENVQIRARLGYLPERLGIPRSYTAHSFLVGVARIRRVDRPDDEARRQLSRVGLQAEANTKVGKFSKGMRQRLGLAAALLGRPELLILDEPTDGVDPLGRIEIRRIMLEERARGATLFLNSHLLSETEKVCDRVAILHQGKVVSEGTIDALAVSSTRWRVRFQTEHPGSAFEALGFTLTEGSGNVLTFRFDSADPETMNLAVERARQLGSTAVVELSRETRDLEDVLAEHVRGPSIGVVPR